MADVRLVEEDEGIVCACEDIYCRKGTGHHALEEPAVIINSKGVAVCGCCVGNCPDAHPGHPDNQ